MKQLLVFLFLLCSATISAQDVIVKKDGTTILSKVLEVNTADIKYKKFSNQNGPTYSISKVEIMSINYENGDKDAFDNTTIPAYVAENTVNKHYVKKTADERNTELIALYNKLYQPTKKLKGKRKDIKGYKIPFIISASSLPHLPQKSRKRRNYQTTAPGVSRHDGR